MKVTGRFVVGSIIVIFILISAVMHIRSTDLSNSQYKPNSKIEKIYQKMIKPDGTIDPYIFNGELDEYDLGALILAAQHCELKDPVPLWNVEECQSFSVIEKYEDEDKIYIHESELREILRNLAYHPNENVRVRNLLTLISYFNDKPKAIFDYLSAQSSSKMDFFAYFNLHSDEDGNPEEDVKKLLASPEYAQYREFLKNSQNPLVRAWIHEENLTPEQIAASIENTEEGVKKVFFADNVHTLKEQEAIFLLFQHCQFNDELQLSGDCFAMWSFRDMPDRPFWSITTDEVDLMLKYGNHPNPSVRGLVWSWGDAEHPDLLKKYLDEEQDVKAIAAYVYFSNNLYVDNTERAPFFEQLKKHPDPRVRALVASPDDIADEFEKYLLNLMNCKENDANCPELVEFNEKFAKNLSLYDAENPIIPVLEKYYNHESRIIQTACAVPVATFAFYRLMSINFNVYFDSLIKNGSNEMKQMVFDAMCALASDKSPSVAGNPILLTAHEVILKNDLAKLKTLLLELSKSMKPNNKQAERENKINQSFK